MKLIDDARSVSIGYVVYLTMTNPDILEVLITRDGFSLGKVNVSDHYCDVDDAHAIIAELIKRDLRKELKRKIVRGAE